MAVNLDVGFNPNGGPLLKFIEDAAAHWRKHFDGVGMGIDTSILKVVQSSVAAAKTVAANEEATHKQAVDSATRAASLKAKAEQDYVALKSKYVLQGLDVTRQAIHEEEQEIKKTRDAMSRASQENLGKETIAVLKAERDKQNARLQGLRSVEKEITGARTFSEQLEKNVYEPIKKEAAKGGAITALLFGEVGTLQKKLKETESQVKAHEEQITAHAKEASAKIEAQEHEHATKLKALEDQISTAKSAEAKKELEAVKNSIQEQIAEERKLTQAAAAEEQLRLQHHQAALEKELSETKAEHAKAASSEHGKGEGVGIGQVVGVGAAIEGFSMLVEKSKEVTAAQKQLQAGTGLGGEALKKEGEFAEELADKLGVTASSAKTSEGEIAGLTHATGEELRKQTEAAIAYEQATGKSASKKIASEKGLEEIMSNASVNIANAQAASADGAVQAELAQAKFQEELGSVANTILQFVAPALKLITAYLPEVLIGVAAVTIAMNAQSIAAKATAIWNGALSVATAVQTAATWALNAAMAVNPFVWIGLAIVALIAIVVLLVKNWDKVIETTKKVFSAIMDAGGAVLSFLGITSKAEAATKKHTDSLKENKKSLEDIKRATEEAATASVAYTDALKKNNEEQEKSAKDMQDSAIAALRDIDAKLKDPSKRLKGDTDASLKAVRALWVQHGKDGVKIQEQNEADAHAKALEIGAASDADKKEGKDKSAKIDKDAYTAEKNAEDIRFGSDQLILERQLAAKAITKEQFDAKNEEAETVHVQKLNDIAAKHRKGHEADAQKAEEALLKIKIAANDKIIKAEADKLKKLEEAHKKEITLQEERDKIQAEIDDAASQARIAGITDETAKAIAEEEARYDKQLTEKAHELGDMKTGQALAESFEANHQNKLTAIVKNAEEERRKKHRETLNEITGASKVYDQAQQAIHAKFFAPILDNWKNQKTFAMQALATIGESFINYIEQWVAKQAEALAAQVADSLISTATTTTAATAAATAWAPAALSASVATFGGADATGLAAYTSAMAAGQAVGHMADGGFVGGIGGERDDRNPRMLSRTEFVVNGRQAPKWAPVLHAINNGAEPNFGGGGRTFMLDEGQVKRLEKHTVLSSQRMLLDNQKTQQQRSRSRI